MRLSNTLVLATNNLHKIEEFKSLFQLYGKADLNLVSASHILRNSEKLAEVEDGTTYFENASAKARIANQGCHYPCLADDSGLEVDALPGELGVRSARYAIAKAGQSQDQANVTKLLESLRGRPFEARKARFVCTLALSLEGAMLYANGSLSGHIAEAPAGQGGFGYDPVFIPDGFQKTLAELGETKKNEISHRSLAVKDLFEQISLRGLFFAKP